MTKKDLPTTAQAKRLAALFGEHKFAQISNRYSSSTDLVLVKRGWVIPTGVIGKFTNDADYAEFQISNDGLYALERFLWDWRVQMKIDAA